MEKPESSKLVAMKMDRAFLWKTAFGLGVVAALLIGVAVQMVHVAGQQDASFTIAGRAHAVKKAIDEVSNQLRSASSAQRAYIVTNDLTHADHYLVTREKTLAALEKLRAEIDGSPAQRSTFLWFHEIVEKQIDIYDATVSAQQDGDFAAVERLLNTVRSVTQMEAIADSIRTMEREEDLVLSTQVGNTRNNMRQTETLVLGGLGLSFLVILFAGLTIFRDLSRRLSVERALESALNFEQALVESAAYGIIAVDANMVITEFNRAAEKMLGYTAEELVGKATPERFYDRQEVVERAATLARELDRTVEPGLDAFVAIPNMGLVEEREWTLVRKDGTRFPAQLSVTAIRGADKRIKGYLSIANDITERRKMERVKAEFISTVSHELRTPLTSIRGSLGLVLGGISGKLPAQAQELLDVANKNSERLSRLINDILDVEKIESGKMEFKLERQPLAPLLQQAVDGIKDFGGTLGITFQLSNNIPHMDVNVDSDRFIQVMVNLLSNAAKFSPAGSPVVVTAERHGKMLRISVADRGKGIPLEFQSRVFEKFAQADSSDSRQKSGTGLGLNITKAIVERLGGAISFDTQEDVGTTFYFDLPDLSGENLAAGPLPDGIARRKVLICEDDRDIAHLLRLMLKQGGFDADVAYSAAEAKARLKTGSYFALSLDINLPDQNGLDFFRELRADPTTQDLPVVVVSAETDKGKRAVNGTVIDVMDWLDKPIDEKRLVKAVRRAICSTSGEKARVLHIEDDMDLTRIVSDILSPVAQVESAGTIAEAMTRIRTESFDLVLLDINLPDGKGFDILPLFAPNLPVVIFSAQDVPEEITRQVSSALVKSRTSNDMLLARITEIIARDLPTVSVAS